MKHLIDRELQRLNKAKPLPKKARGSAHYKATFSDDDIIALRQYKVARGLFRAYAKYLRPETNGSQLRHLAEALCDAYWGKTWNHLPVPQELSRQDKVLSTKPNKDNLPPATLTEHMVSEIRSVYPPTPHLFKEYALKYCPEPDNYWYVQKYRSILLAAYRGITWKKIPNAHPDVRLPKKDYSLDEFEKFNTE